MSKKQNEKKADEIPLDHVTETKNLQYTIVLREAEIHNLQLDNSHKAQVITQLETEIVELRLNCINSFKNENEVKKLSHKVESIEKENERLKDEAILSQMKFEEEKRQLRTEHDNEVNRMKSIVENCHQKMEMVNQLISEKDHLKDQVAELQKDKDKLINDHFLALQRKEVGNQNKFSKLKKKMMENINQTQSKVTELNIQYMDVSTKLTLLQNHQLLIQLEYQTQQIEDLMIKKETLEKKVFEFTKDLEIHKEVELALAEKNKKLQLDSKKRDNDNDDNNNTIQINTNQNKNGINQTYCSENSNTKEYTNILNLEKKIYHLEKKLNQKSKEYNQLKASSEYIEIRLKKYEKKYAGLFSFFEESLQKFFEDEDIKNNKEIYVNIDSLKQGDFSVFSKEEKYSILVILMKYLLPLINSNDDPINQSNTSNVSLKFRYSQKYMDDPELKKVFAAKGVRNALTMPNQSYESLPSIKNSLR